MPLPENAWTETELTECIQELLKSDEMQQSLQRDGAREFWIDRFTNTPTDWQPNSDDLQLADIINGLVLSYAYATAHAHYREDKDVSNFMEAVDKMWDEDQVSEAELERLTAQLPAAYTHAIEQAVEHAYACFAQELHTQKLS